MKRQVRSSVFETNSSSTHSIVVSKKPVAAGGRIHFGIGEFGWENDRVSIVDYLYTAILLQKEHNELLDRLKGILDNNSIEYEFEEPLWWRPDGSNHVYLDNGHIDHYDETREFVFAVLDNEDLLMRCLFGDSCVYTGNDNQDSEPDGCNIASQHVYVVDNGGRYVQVQNPYHDPANYDYFYKGN